MAKTPRQFISPFSGISRPIPEPDPTALLAAALAVAPGSGEVLSAQASGQAGQNMLEALRGQDYSSAAAYGAQSITDALGAVPLLGLAARGIKRFPALFHGTPDLGSKLAILEDGFYRGGSAEVGLPGTSTSADPLVSLQGFANQDPNLVLRVRPQGSPKEVRNLRPSEYLQRKVPDKTPSDFVRKPNFFFAEDELFALRKPKAPGEVDTKALAQVDDKILEAIQARNAISEKITAALNAGDKAEADRLRIGYRQWDAHLNDLKGQREKLQSYPAPLKAELPTPKDRMDFSRDQETLALAEASKGSPFQFAKWGAQLRSNPGAFQRTFSNFMHENFNPAVATEDVITSRLQLDFSPDRLSPKEASALAKEGIRLKKLEDSLSDLGFGSESLPRDVDAKVRQYFRRRDKFMDKLVEISQRPVKDQTRLKLELRGGMSPGAAPRVKPQLPSPEDVLFGGQK